MKLQTLKDAVRMEISSIEEIEKDTQLKKTREKCEEKAKSSEKNKVVENKSWFQF